jgi:5-methylcytosine-specific restriction endonuclease McrA
MLGWKTLQRHYLNLTAKDGASLNWSWQRCKREFFKIVPKECALCASKKKVHVHHIKPRHLFPQLALVLNNLIALCAGCHLRVGHWGSYFKYNETITEVSNFVRKHSIIKLNKKVA